MMWKSKRAPFFVTSTQTCPGNRIIYTFYSTCFCIRFFLRLLRGNIRRNLIINSLVLHVSSVISLSKIMELEGPARISTSIRFRKHRLDGSSKTIRSRTAKTKINVLGMNTLMVRSDFDSVSLIIYIHSSF